MTNGAMDKTLLGKNLKEIIQDSDLAKVEAAL